MEGNAIGKGDLSKIDRFLADILDLKELKVTSLVKTERHLFTRGCRWVVMNLCQ